jgi:hypothetical protein
MDQGSRHPSNSAATAIRLGFVTQSWYFTATGMELADACDRRSVVRTLECLDALRLRATARIFMHIRKLPKPPLYEVLEIDAFIRDYRAFDRNAEAEVKPEIIYVELDIRTGAQRRLAHPPRPLTPTATATVGAAHAH